MHGSQFPEKKMSDLPGTGLCRTQGEWTVRYMGYPPVPGRPGGPVTEDSSVNQSGISHCSAEPRRKLTGPRWTRGPVSWRRRRDPCGSWASRPWARI